MKENIMAQKNREPKLPVNKKEAMEHALLTIRRAWAGEVKDFEKWGGYDLDPKPLTIYDLNGQVLFYEFDVMNGNKVVGSTKTAASKTIGSPVITMEFGERSWDFKKASKEAEKKVKKLFPKADITESELVCYSYPKIGVRVYFDTAKAKEGNLIFDISTLDLIERYASDEMDNFACRSFYNEIDGIERAKREALFELDKKELEAIKAKRPKVLERNISSRKLADIKPLLVPQPVHTVNETLIPSNIVPIPFYSSKTIRFSPRCNSHECFELYAQKTDVYCAVASGQMLLDFYRYYYTQDQIAIAMSTGTHGTSVSGIVNGIKSLSKNCLNVTSDHTISWSEVTSEINANRPFMSCIPGHARVCVGWKKQNLYTLWQKPKTWVKIYDPWPWNADICNGGRTYWESWSVSKYYCSVYLEHRNQPC